MSNVHLVLIGLRRNTTEIYLIEQNVIVKLSVKLTKKSKEIRSMFL